MDMTNLSWTAVILSPLLVTLRRRRRLNLRWYQNPLVGSVVAGEVAEAGVGGVVEVEEVVVLPEPQDG